MKKGEFQTVKFHLKTESSEIGWKLKLKKWEVEKIIVFEILETQCSKKMVEVEWALPLEERQEMVLAVFLFWSGNQNLQWSEGFNRNIRPNRKMENFVHAFNQCQWYESGN